MTDNDIFPAMAVGICVCFHVPKMSALIFNMANIDRNI